MLAVGAYRDELTSNFDYDLWVWLASSSERLARLPLPLAVKRIHPDQAFLYHRRLPYLAGSVEIQARAVRALGGRQRDMALLPLRFLWGLLSVDLRPCRL